MKNCGANARGNFLPCLLLCFEKDPTARAEPSLVETPRALSVGGRLSSPEDEGWEFRVGRAGLGSGFGQLVQQTFLGHAVSSLAPKHRGSRWTRKSTASGSGLDVRHGCGCYSTR